MSVQDAVDAELFHRRPRALRRQEGRDGPGQVPRAEGVLSTSCLCGQAGSPASATAATAGASAWPAVPRMQCGTGRSRPSARGEIVGAVGVEREEQRVPVPRGLGRRGRRAPDDALRLGRAERAVHKVVLQINDDIHDVGVRHGGLLLVWFVAAAFRFSFAGPPGPLGPRAFRGGIRRGRTQAHRFVPTAEFQVKISRKTRKFSLGWLGGQ